MTINKNKLPIATDFCYGDRRQRGRRAPSCPPGQRCQGRASSPAHCESLTLRRNTCSQRASVCSSPPAHWRSPVCVAGCTTGGAAATPAPTNNANNDETGDTITIGFSGPAADHGWLGAINSAAIAEAAKYPDIDLVVAEGTNDANLQISQVETFINDGVDAIVLLPTDGAALTEVAIQAMEAGIPVINVDREFSSTFAARTTDPR